MKKISLVSPDISCDFFEPEGLDGFEIHKHPGCHYSDLFFNLPDHDVVMLHVESKDFFLLSMLSNFKNGPVKMNSQVVLLSRDADVVNYFRQAGLTSFHLGSDSLSVIAFFLNEMIDNSSAKSSLKNKIISYELLLDDLEKKKFAYNDLLRTVTHDFANQLTVQKFASLLMLRKMESGETLVRGDIEKIIRANNSLIGCLEQIRSACATEIGKIIPDLQKVSVLSLVENMADVFQNELKQRKVSLVVNNTIQRNDVWIKVNESLFLNQALPGILKLSTACAMPGASIDLEINEINRIVCIRIKDNGNGLKKDMQDIFSVIHIKKMIEKMNGKISFEYYRDEPYIGNGNFISLYFKEAV